MNAAVVALIAKAFTEGLPHPGDGTDKQPPKLLHLPPLRHSGIPAAMAEEFAAEAGFASNDTPQLLAEAIDNLITLNGMTVIDTAELDALRTEAADAPDGNRRITVYCRCDTQLQNPLMRLTVPKTDQVIVDGRIFQPCNGVH